MTSAAGKRGGWRILLGGALLVSAWLAPPAVAQDATVRVGVLGIRGEAWAHERFDATARYLTEAVDGHRFVVVPMSLPSSERLVSQGRVDFVVTQPANYVVLEHRFGLTRMATMRNQTPAGAFTEFGSVIFTRADGPVRTLRDLPGRSLMAISPRGFGGFLMSKLLLVENGIVPEEDMRVEFCGFPQDQIPRAVRDGRIDVGVVRTNVLERMAQQGEIDLADYRIIHDVTDDSFPYIRSTPLYPEWAFAVAAHTDEELAQRVAVALLQLPADHPASRAAHNAGWTVPLDYGPVHEVLRELREPPYENVGRVTFQQAFQQYWHVILLVLVGLALMAGVVVHVLRLNRRMRETNEELATQIEERRRMEHQLVASEKMASVGQLAAGIAHEINSPLGYVYSNIGTLRRSVRPLLELLDGYEAQIAGEMSDERLDELRSASEVAYLREDLPDLVGESLEGLERMREIVMDMKSFSHVGDDDWQVVDLRESMQSTINIVRKTVEKKGQLHLELGEIPRVECLASQLNQVFMNLILNAYDAIADDGEITVRTYERDANHVAVEVQDTGPGIPAEMLRRVFDPFYTSKPVGQGTGLGLTISLRIVKSHGGDIEVDTKEGTGTTFRIILPRRPDRRTRSGKSSAAGPSAHEVTA